MNMYDKKPNNKFSCLGMITSGYLFGERKKKRSKRNHSRANKTYQKKLNRLKTRYERLYKNSVKSQEAFQKLSETEQNKILTQKSQGRDTPRVFFCVEYKTFESYLAKHNLKQVTREEPKVSKITSSFSKPNFGVWGKKK